MPDTPGLYPTNIRTAEARPGRRRQATPSYTPELCLIMATFASSKVAILSSSCLCAQESPYRYLIPQQRVGPRAPASGCGVVFAEEGGMQGMG